MSSLGLASTIANSPIPLSERGPAPKEVVIGFGFWLFLLSDIVIFAALFACYAVLSGAVASGPTGPALFDRSRVFVETLCLLLSSVTCGFGSLAVQRRHRLTTYMWLGGTFVLGLLFLKQEFAEFSGMLASDAGPTRSAFLSAFYTLVGTHGLHVTIGLVWLLGMMSQLLTLGFQPMVQRRFFCFALFWHALDIVWIGVFTIVYLGAH
jgi:cytochrome o ubiquinol oxidase subunit III